MSIVIQPDYTASCTNDDNGSKQWTRSFVLRDSEDIETAPADAYIAAYDYVKANKSYDGLTAKSIELDSEGDGAQKVWRFTVTYTIDGALGEDDPQTQTVVGTLRFSTKGEMTHINHAIQTRVRRNNQNLGQVAPDFGTLINVQDNTPVGVDIQVPCLHVDVTAKIPTQMVTSQWLSTYYNLTGKVNNNALWGFPAYTLIFRGLDGDTDGSGTCSLTFSFDFSPTVNKNIAPFGNFTKYGWEYVWVHNTLTTDTSSNTTVATPDGLYVQQVYEEVSFAPFQFITVL